MDPKGLLMIGAVLVGGYVALTTLDGAEIDLTGVEIPLGGRDREPEFVTRAEGLPGDHIREGFTGRIAGDPIANHDGPDEAVFIADAFADWRPATGDEVVGKVQLTLNRTDCSLRPPVPDARVVNLQVAHPETEVGLWSYDDEVLLEGVGWWYDNIEQRGSDRVPSPAAIESIEFHMHDIAITDTAQPVHLVLHNIENTGRLVYNIHLAPGAQVSGVTMLGGVANAVANIGPDVPVDAIDRATLAECGLVHETMESGDTRIRSQRNSGRLRGEDDIAEARAQLSENVAAFDAWFHAALGLHMEETLIGLRYAETSLIGPVLPPGGTPEAPVPGGVTYRSLDGAYLVAQTQAYFRLNGLHDWPEAFKAEVRAEGARLAGGNPTETLFPLRRAKGM